MRNTMPSAVGAVIDAEQRPRRALGLGGIAFVHEHDVDVARVVQLGAAELAHADHRHGDGRRGHRQCGTEAGLRDRGKLGADGAEVGDAEQVTGGDADHAAVLPAAQRRARLVGGDRRARLCNEVVDRRGGGERVGAQDVDRAVVAFEDREE